MNWLKSLRSQPATCEQMSTTFNFARDLAVKRAACCRWVHHARTLIAALRIDAETAGVPVEIHLRAGDGSIVVRHQNTDVRCIAGGRARRRLDGKCQRPSGRGNEEQQGEKGGAAFRHKLAPWRSQFTE